MNFIKEALARFAKAQLGSKAWLAPVRYALWMSRARKDQAASATIAETLGIQPLKIPQFSFSDSKGSETLFILGSGSSVNELTPENFEEIQSAVSVGINIWVAHDFIPDVYSFESTDVPISPDEEAQLHRMGLELSRMEVLRAAPKILLLRPPAPSGTAQFVHIPETLRARTFIYGRSNLFPTDPLIAPFDVENFVAKYLDTPSPQMILPDNGASVVRLIFLALSKKFTRIVLVGVDLNSAPYFWYSEAWRSKRPDMLAVFPRPEGKDHDTTETKNRPYNTRDLIRWISQATVSMGASKIYVGSKTSSLAEFLPVHRWKIKTPSTGVRSV